MKLLLKEKYQHTIILRKDTDSAALNKANTSDKETFFLHLNVKNIGSDVHTTVYDKRDDLGFPIVNFPLLSVDVPRHAMLLP